MIVDHVDKGRKTLVLIVFKPKKTAVVDDAKMEILAGMSAGRRWED